MSSNIPEEWPDDWPMGAIDLIERGEQRIAELGAKLATQANRCVQEANRAEAAEAKLADIARVDEMRECEASGEFHRGQCSGWNQCRAYIASLLQEEGR